VSAGALRRRVAIARPAATADGGGGREIAWEAVATVFAAVRPVRAEERDELGRLDGVATDAVEVRAGTDVRGGDQLQVSGRTLRVLAVRVADPRGRRLIALAEEAGR
jgi:SPP1 family predicted phage head-tail adaptor